MYTSIAGINKAKLLAALYNNAQAIGLGIFQMRAEPMTEQQAAELLKTSTGFDYLYGRVMKIDIGGDEARIDLYDRDNGHGAAQRIIDSLH